MTILAINPTFHCWVLVQIILAHAVSKLAVVIVLPVPNVDKRTKDGKLAFYCNAVKTIYQTPDYPAFIFIPVEKVAPFECSISSGKLYGYEDRVQTIGLPN